MLWGESHGAAVAFVVGAVLVLGGEWPLAMLYGRDRRRRRGCEVDGVTLGPLALFGRFATIRLVQTDPLDSSGSFSDASRHDITSTRLMMPKDFYIPT